MGFPRQEYCSGLPFPPPWYLPDPEIEATSPVCLLLGRQILYHWATWEADKYIKILTKHSNILNLLDCQKLKEQEYWILSNTYLLHYWQDSKLSRLVLKIIGRLCMLSHFSHVQLCDPMDCSPPGSSVHGILQARILEWVAVSFSRGSSRPINWIHIAYVSCIGRRFFTSIVTWEACLWKS